METKKRRRRVRRHVAPSIYKGRVRKLSAPRKRSVQKSFLSELFSPQTVNLAGNALISGIIGGGAITLIDKMLFKETDIKPIKRIGIPAIATLLTAFLIKKPNVAAGMAGATTAILIKQYFPNGLSENMSLAQNAEYVNLQKLPAILDEFGQPLSEGEANYALAQNR